MFFNPENHSNLLTLNCCKLWAKGFDKYTKLVDKKEKKYQDKWSPNRTTETHLFHPFWLDKLPPYTI